MKRFLMAVAALGLAACTAVPTAPRDFSASGRFAAKGELEGRAVNEQGRFRWWRTGEHAELELGSPLGETQLRVISAGSAMQVELPDGSIRATDDPDALLLELTGITLPVRALRWWIEGEPAPDLPFERQDSGFEQAGWQVVLSGANPVPQRLTLRRDAFELRLVVTPRE
ncbi:lipoprotein insertase outer membrane protein LolB [Chitinibacteraceae bacterium HSL-7]